jgi:hypothetical protein
VLVHNVHVFVAHLLGTSQDTSVSVSVAVSGEWIHVRGHTVSITLTGLGVQCVGVVCVSGVHNSRSVLFIGTLARLSIRKEMSHLLRMDGRIGV